MSVEQVEVRRKDLPSGILTGIDVYAVRRCTVTIAYGVNNSGLLIPIAAEVIDPQPQYAHNSYEVVDDFVDPIDPVIDSMNYLHDMLSRACLIPNDRVLHPVRR